MNHNLFCISDEELAAEVASLSPADRAVLDALPKPKKHDARRDSYPGPFPRKRHYHRCDGCKKHGSNGVNCYKQRCTRPVLVESCSWCRAVVAPVRTNKDAPAWRVAAFGDDE